jgi:hypothetical protein
MVESARDADRVDTQALRSGKTALMLTDADAAIPL